MPSLKDLRNRIDSVKSTKKITQAMKMVAASKLKKAQLLAEKGRSYSKGLDEIVGDLVSSVDEQSHPLLGMGSRKGDSALIIAVSSDKGLCGGLNSNIAKSVRKKIRELENIRKSISLVCVGKKGFDLLSNLNKNLFDLNVKHMPIGDMDYRATEDLGNIILKNFYDHKFDECFLFYK